MSFASVFVYHVSEGTYIHSGNLALNFFTHTVRGMNDEDQDFWAIHQDLPGGAYSPSVHQVSHQDSDQKTLLDK